MLRNGPELINWRQNYQLTVIEDAAQAIGAGYPSEDGTSHQAGTMSAAAALSFVAPKNLGAAGDAGAIITGNEELAARFSHFSPARNGPRCFHHVIGGNFGSTRFRPRS